MRVQRQIVSYSEKPRWQDIHCPVRILDDEDNVIYQDSYEEKRVVKVNKLKFNK